MARIETWFEQDLKKPVIVHRLDSVFSQDAKGNLIGVKVFSDGVAVALTDSITGYCVLADGSTVPVSGSRSGNQASIILPASAYNVPGPIMITVKNTGSDYVTTLCAVAGLVVRSRTGSQVSPGSVVTDWTNQISAQLQAVQTAADNLGSVLAVPFSNLTAYSAGNYVMKDGNLYCFTTDHAAGEWNSSQVRAVKLANEVADLKSAVNDNSGIEIIDIIKGYYIKTSDSTVDISSRTQSSTGLGYAVIECQSGDKFTISGEGATSGRLWAFIDSSGNRLAVSASNAIADNLILTAPDDSAYLVINSKSDKTCFKGISTINNALTVVRSLTSGDDCDDLTELGIYYCTGTNAANVTHWPTTASGGRLVQFLVKGSQSGRAQIVFCLNNDLYYRVSDGNYSGSVFGPWVKIADDNGTQEIKTLMQEGSIPSSSGKWASGIGNFGRSVATLKRYKISNAKKLNVSWTPKHSSDSFTVIEYGADGVRVTSTSFTPGTVGTEQTNSVTPNSSTKSVAFACYAKTGTVPNKQITIQVNGTGATIEEIKNPSFGSNVTNTRWYRFGYKVGDYISDGVETPIYNTGMMMMPPNYNTYGKPVPVIIVAHGSNAYMELNGTELASYEPFYNYLNDCGYALIDCYGWTNRYPDASGLSNSWTIPTSCKAYLKLVELLTDSFNIDKNNMFIISKSLGGHMNGWLSTVLPVRGSCMLAPAIRLNFGYAASGYRPPMVTDLGLIGVEDSDLGWESAEACLTDFVSNYSSWSKQKRERFYLANEKQIMGWTPEFVNVVGNTASEKLTASANNVLNQTSLAKLGCPPTKIWYAMDDDVISPTFCETYVQQIRNAGTQAETRIMPNGTGGHHSVDTDENALRTENVTTPLGYEYESVPTAYYEMWEFMEKYRLK